VAEGRKEEENNWVTTGRSQVMGKKFCGGEGETDAEKNGGHISATVEKKTRVPRRRKLEYGSARRICSRIRDLNLGEGNRRQQEKGGMEKEKCRTTENEHEFIK